MDARVSCHDQKAGLDRQVALLPAWPGQAGLPVVRDMTGVLRSLCAGRYGRRPARNRVLTAVGCARRGIGPRAVLTAGSISCGGAG